MAEVLLKYLRTDEAAAYTRKSPSTLTKNRLTGDGPPFIKAGRTVLYDIEDLDRWLAERKRRSTSEADPEAD